MTSSQIIPVALMLLLIPAVISDVRTRRIPNALVFPAWGVGVALGFLLGGIDGGLVSLGGLGVALLVGVPFWAVGWMGAGDIKLLAAVGALVGSATIWPVLGAVGVSGLFLALAALLYRGLLAQALKRYWASLSMSYAARRGIYVRPGEAEQEVRLPYAIAIAAGTIVAYIWVAM